MSRINRDNYEAYMLDFAEGNLSEEMQVELELFLIQHPELNINLSEESLLTIEANEVSFRNKQQLKKTNSDLVSDSQFVAYIENQLEEKEKATVEKSCANNLSLAHELKLYQKTKIVADTNITFPDKNKLKRRNKVVWFNFSSTQYSIAASVALLLALYVFWPKQVYVGSIQQIAINHKTLINSVNDIQKNNMLIAENTNAKNVTTNSTNQRLVKTAPKEHHLPVANNQTQQEEGPTIESKHKNEAPIDENKNLVAINEPKTTLKDNSAKSKTVVEVITESDDDIAIEQPKKRKSFWTLAERALQNLNALGVKSVNANTEASGKDNSSTYALTLGKVSVTHKSN